MFRFETVVVELSIQVFSIGIQIIVIIVGTVSGNTPLKAELFIRNIQFVIEPESVEATIIQFQIIRKIILEIQIIVQMNASANGTASVNRTSSACTNIDIIKISRRDGIEIRLTVKLRIDVDAVPNYSRLLGRSSSKRRRRNHPKSVFLEIKNGIVIQQRSQRSLIVVDNRIG